jgi:DNA repair protein RecN (Recombination protein N)
MLSQIDIRNFTIIPTLSLEFSPGMTVLTGETGAGKSIILNALALALGARAKKNLVRDEKVPAEITLSFQVNESSLAFKWLESEALAQGCDCIIRRVIYADGRSKSTINGRPCSLSSTKELAEHLIHIHSQHQQQQLLKPSWQSECLDHFADHAQLLEAVEQQAMQWQNLEAQITEALENKKDHSHELALIEYQLTELRELSPVENEWQTLSEQHDLLAQAQTIQASVERALMDCRDQEGNNAQQLLEASVERLQELPVKNKLLQNAIDMLKNSVIHCQEACDEIASFSASIECNEEKLITLNDRLDKLDKVARKHRISQKELPQQLCALEKKRHTLIHLDEYVDGLKKQQKACLSQYEMAAKKLTESRKGAADRLSKQITSDIQVLNMPGSEFLIALYPRMQQPHKLGAEILQFKLSTQPNKPPQALGDIASGGELSRITLTLMLATAQSTRMPVFIFDEIDVGMGGQTAKLVGQLIQGLSDQAQIFCITHLPQVAALGHHHFRIDKALNDAVVTSTIQRLNKKDRIEELARMTSGDELTEVALAHASSLVDNY